MGIVPFNQDIKDARNTVCVSVQHVYDEHVGRASERIGEDDTELNFLGVATDNGVVSAAGQLAQLNKIVSFCSCDWHLQWQTFVHSQDSPDTCTSLAC